MANSFNKIKLGLLTDIEMLLMIEKGIRGGIRHTVYGYTKPNKRYTRSKGHYKNKELSNLK